MPKQRISATVDPERLAVARALAGGATVSAVLDNTFTLHRERFDARITDLGHDRLFEVCTAYRFAADC